MAGSGSGRSGSGRAAGGRIKGPQIGGTIANRTGTSRQLNRFNSRQVTSYSQSLDQYAAKRGLRRPDGLMAQLGVAFGGPNQSAAARGKAMGAMRRAEAASAKWDLASRKYQNAIRRGVVTSSTRRQGLDLDRGSDRALGRTATKAQRLRARSRQA